MLLKAPIEQRTTPPVGEWAERQAISRNPTTYLWVMYFIIPDLFYTLVGVNGAIAIVE